MTEEQKVEEEKTTDDQPKEEVAQEEKPVEAAEQPKEGEEAKAPAEGDKPAEEPPKEGEAPAEAPAQEAPPAAIQYDPDAVDTSGWDPLTELGRMVKKGEITSMSQALASGYRIREPMIVDVLLPELEDEVLDVNMVQRMTDSGRRVKFSVYCVVGNGDGFVGLGRAKGKEVGPTIRKAIDNAKLNIIEIKRGCGSWECGCERPHTVPFTVNGKAGSVRVTFKPAPQGIGLAAADVAKSILKLAGITDVWGFTKGQTRTTINYAQAVYAALVETSKVRTMKGQDEDLGIVSGSQGGLD